MTKNDSKKRVVAYDNEDLETKADEWLIKNKNLE